MNDITEAKFSSESEALDAKDATPQTSGHQALLHPYASTSAEDEFAVANPQLKDIYAEILMQIGENPSRGGLIKTPHRASMALSFLTQGYHQDSKEILNGAIFNEDYDDMIIVKNIEFYSLCEHHILPFFGNCHVGYIPSGKIIGLSKIPRIVDMFARRLQVQERLTYQIAQTLDEALQPLGVAVVIEAQHMCMMIRGVEKQNSKTITNVMLGAFRDKDSTRAEFMQSCQST
jgi:GTP cyclohydrolase I